MDKKEKVFRDKVKRFDRIFLEIYLNILISVITTIFIYTKFLM